MLGVFALVVGALVVVLNFAVRPLLQLLLSGYREAGAGYFVASVFLGLLGWVGNVGLLLFEFNQLLSFEAACRRAIS